MRVSQLALLCSLAACGGGGGGSAPEGEASLRSLAYVVTSCHEDARSSSWHQELRIQHGAAAAVTVKEITFSLPQLGLCHLFGQYRIGLAAAAVGAFQRIGMSPDGSSLVFEVTFDFSILAPLGFRSPLQPEQGGIFRVRADGTGLQRLGPASRAPDFFFSLPTASGGAGAYPVNANFTFSADGQRITFTDLGPGPAGEEATQIVTLDLPTGARTVLTHLPATAHPNVADTFLTGFIDNETILFFSSANPDGLNRDGTHHFFTIKTDGTDLKLSDLKFAVGSGELVRSFSITPGTSTIFTFGDPNILAVNPFPGNDVANEVYSLAGENLLQLTSFRRTDTAQLSTTLSADAHRAFFSASANPPVSGTNPTEDCQLFSIDTLGTDLRQLTSFHAAGHSNAACIPSPDRFGCYVYPGTPDAETQSLPFISTCDPLGANPDGEQIFVMRQDGTGIRQLTDLRGVVTAADGSIDVELPGPNVP